MIRAIAAYLTNERRSVLIISTTGRSGLLHFASNQGVQRPCAGTLDQQIDRSQQHAEVGAGFVRHAPESITRQFRRLKDQKVVPEQNRHFCRHDCDNHDDDQRDRRESGEEADNDECAAHRFDHTYKRTHEIGIRDADIGETPVAAQYLSRRATSGLMHPWSGRAEVPKFMNRKPRAREWAGLVGKLKPRVACYARESSDNPILKAFCRVAPSVRFRDLAIFFAGVFLRANVLSSRTCSAVQARLFFDPFFITYLFSG